VMLLVIGGWTPWNRLKAMQYDLFE